MFDDDAFGLHDDHGFVHRRQYSTETLSTTDGITVVSPSSTFNQQDKFSTWNSNWTGRLLNNLWFKRVLLALIVAQSVVVAISTTKYVSNDEQLARRFWLARKCFLFLFTTELLLRLIRYRFNVFKSGWLIFDLLVIGGSWLLPQLLVLRTFRVLRSLRHATRFHHLRDVTLALGKAIPKAMAIVYLLAIIFYIFAVIFTSNYKDDFEEFRRLDATLSTLFQIMTLDDWSELARRLMAENSWAWLPFCAFITSSTLFLVNFVVAVMIQALVPLPNVRHDELDQPPSQVTRRLEAKVDQLLGIVEAIRQKQNHMDSLVGSSVAKSSFEDTTREDAFVYDELKD